MSFNLHFQCLSATSYVMKFRDSLRSCRLLWKRLQYLHSTQHRCHSTLPLSSAFNSSTSRRLNFLFKEKNEGLFNIPELTGPDGFKVIEEKCLTEVSKLMQEACDPKRKRKMVSIFDDMSDCICRVADMVEFIRVSHPDPKYRHAAEQTCLTMSELVERLNTNAPIYQALKAAVTEGDVQPLSDVDMRVSQLFKFDFEQSGIHFDEMKRLQFVEINNALLRICNNFMHASQQPTPQMDFNFNPDLQKSYSRLDIKNKSSIRTRLHSEHMVEGIREAAYRVYLSPNPNTEELLHSMLEARHLIANLTGFKSYAHRALKGTLAESPENVMKFLETLAENIRDGAREDYRIMKKMKRRDHEEFPEVTYSTEIRPWDPAYFTNKCRHQMFNFRQVLKYFSLGTCMEGLSILFERLFDVRLEAMEPVSGEVWNNDIHKLAVVHSSEGVLGFIYCDFFERADKPNQDCHFTIQGGRRKANGDYQHPIVVLHLNFKPPSVFSPCLLSPAQIENLFHEFGHAMHSMLGRTEYQHVSGTRCPIDFAEVPSVLMEYFVSDPRVVQLFARDYSSGEVLNENELMNYCMSKRLFLHSELQLQVFYGIVDQVYHGPDFFPMKKTSTQWLKELQNKYYGIPYVENTAWQLRFGHLVGYGGKYYSYLMSRAVASRIWSQLFRNDPLSRESGEKYRRELLAHGGEYHPSVLIKALLGEEPTIEMLTESLTEDLRERSVVPR